mmetsp:Transcript_17174/g.41338  ORF Transcript_17174/g.41338 Transcript_17174/m.41338 type:complete len:217 (-) Transcript_17174:1144-1794(-)
MPAQLLRHQAPHPLRHPLRWLKPTRRPRRRRRLDTAHLPRRPRRRPRHQLRHIHPGKGQVPLRPAVPLALHPRHARVALPRGIQRGQRRPDTRGGALALDAGLLPGLVAAEAQLALAAVLGVGPAAQGQHELGCRARAVGGHGAPRGPGGQVAGPEGGPAAAEVLRRPRRRRRGFQRDVHVRAGDGLPAGTSDGDTAAVGHAHAPGRRMTAPSSYW